MHKSVLLNEAIDGLNLGNNSVVIDGTFGAGGHSREILRRHGKARIIALDQDGSVAKNLDSKDSRDFRISFHNENFRNLDKVLREEKLAQAKGISGIILDLGLSSDQLADSGRGFSFMKDEPLLMTFKSISGSTKNMKEKVDYLPRPEDLSAEDVVNDWSQDSLEKIIRGYGEEKFAGRIARGIVEARKKNKLRTTFDLVRAIESVVPARYKKGRIHFATRTFQALRIAVNDELGALSEALKKGFEALGPKGRLAVISFHSLEDRIVKRFNKEKEKEGKAKFINKKPITASREELKNNPRARSAKLRILEKI